MLQHETGLPVSQDRQLCRNAARARQQARVGVGAGRWASGRATGAERAWARGRALQAAGRSGAVAGGARGRLGERQQSEMKVRK